MSHPECCFCKSSDCSREATTGIQVFDRPGKTQLDPWTKAGTEIWNPVCEKCIAGTRWMSLKTRKINGH